MNTEELRKERIQLFKDAIQMGKKPQRIPYFGNIWSWKIIDAGYKLSEALYDYEVTEKVLRHVFENYKIDVLSETGWRNPVQVTSVMGNDEYIINDTANSISIKDQCFMEADEYDELIDNPKKFLWEKVVPRKYRLLREEENNSGHFREFLQKYGEFGGFMGKVSKVMNKEYGIPDFADSLAAFDYWGNGYELLFNILRGIKGLSIDMRRDPEKVSAAIEALDETFMAPRLERGKKQPKGTNMDFCVDMNPVMLGHTILSPKQFERFYWPHLKRVSDFAESYDKVVYIFAEGESSRFYEFFQEFPKGHFAIHTEQDDIFELKKRVPNIAVAGGMKSSLLGKGTPQECVDYAKKLIDELGADGGYIFSENKMISFEQDCKAENLKAVSDFVSEYNPY